MNTERTPPVAMTIAGSDSGGGAGIQADLATFASLQVFGTSAITALTAQNTTGVQAIYAVPASFVVEQVRSVTRDIYVRAAKTGMLASAEIIKCVAELVAGGELPPPVVDPVMVSASGSVLLPKDAIATLAAELIPNSTIVTPNANEAALLTGIELHTERDMEEAARRLWEMGARAALVKGGHLSGDDSVDVFFDGSGFAHLRAPRIDTLNTHGTGCTLSAAIAAGLARGLDIFTACEAAKRYVTRAIHGARSWGIGRGNGPINHFDTEGT